MSERSKNTADTKRYDYGNDWVKDVYGPEEFAAISKTVGKSANSVAAHRDELEACAFWYRSHHNREPRTQPYKIKKRLDLIEVAAKRLLERLAIDDPKDAMDGPGDPELLFVLASAVGERSDASLIVDQTAKIGRLAEILAGIRSTQAIRQIVARAQQREEHFTRVRKENLTRVMGSGEHPDDIALNLWIAGMLDAYEKITGRIPGTSIGAGDRKNEGKASGPLIRFLAAASAPLGIKLNNAGWRGRIRRILSPTKQPDADS